MGAVKAEDSSSTAPDLKKYPYLASLNAAQLKAVTANPATPLQILAGPGSGKTGVLTSRVAYLVQYHGYKPGEITAVTFTNKAASEMRKRLEVLLGPKEAGALVLGTFHATCAKFLRRYGHIIDLQNNFSIVDADDCKKIMSRLIKGKADVLEGSRIALKDKAVLSEISKAKAKAETLDEMAIRAANDPSSSTSTLAFIAELYGEYEAALREANSLDFDDLLVFGLRLFTEAPRVLESCRHILVDEFQDTNTTQYELMRCFAKAHGGVSVVGDPDQSIYGWRSAEVENLNNMARDFAGTEAIYLEENYRSTGSILAAAHSVVSQDRDRIQKSLFTSHPKSTPVTLKTFSTPVIEASFIAVEIKRLIAYSGNVLRYDDFAILLRYNALSRVIESTLQKESVPNRIVGGHKFFERMEIKDLLAYLQLAENPGFTPAFVRVVNVPKRAIGDKSVADLLSAAKAEGVSPMELSERIIDGDKLPVGIKPAIKRNLASFVGIIRKLRRAATRGSSVADLLRMTIEKTGYEDYLKGSQPDWDSRWENVQELISYSVTVAEEQIREVNPDAQPTFTSAKSAAIEAMVELEVKKEDIQLHPIFRRSSTGTSSSGSRSTSVLDDQKVPKVVSSRKRPRKIEEGIIEVLSSDEETPVGRERKKVKEETPLTPLDEVGLDVLDFKALPEGEANPSLTPLTYFLQTSMLSTDTEGQQEAKDTPVNNESRLSPSVKKLIRDQKVTITTVHAAKGLEWPVVFIPAVEGGTYPMYRCTEAHEIAEERRLLYVAMTRAQNFLTISHCHFRMAGGEESDKELSEFIRLSQKRDPGTFTTELPDVDLAVRRNMAKMLARPAPDEDETKELIMKHVRTAPPLSMWDTPDPQDRNFNRFARREVTKAARAADYWASEHDEYALPDGKSNGFRPSSHGFAPARAFNKPKQQPQAEAKPPPVKGPPREHNLPEALPFTFNLDPALARPASDIGGFANASHSSLAMMKNLGLPDSSPGNSSPITSPGMLNSPKLPGLGSFQDSAKGAMDDWKSLGPPDLGSGSGLGLGGGGTGVKLGGGSKRLGMGRPVPWGAKKARQG